MTINAYLFLLSCGILVYAYGIFPGLMIMMGKKWAIDKRSFDELPEVVVVLAAYNEEAVIEEKVHRTFATTYPSEKLQLVVGTDCCSDSTDEILRRLVEQYPSLTVVPFLRRTGKPQIINNLVEAYTSESEILILTDADTLFFPSTIERLIEPLADTKVGGVQGHIISTRKSPLNKKKEIEAVGGTEVAFNNWDLGIKRGESQFGAVIGALGACYALRKEAYEPVPKGFINDDLFIFLYALNAGWKCVIAPEAKCEMEVSGLGRVQYRRKVRIAQGSFQLLRHFPNWMLPWRKAGFFLLSHKVLRWCTPVWLLVLIGSALPTIYQGVIDNPIFGIVVIQLLGWLIYRSYSSNTFLPKVKHVLQMNVALLEGMWRAFTKKSDGTWSNT